MSESRVLIDGVDATLDPRTGTYAIQLTTATRLRPGLNRLTVETRDATGAHLEVEVLGEPVEAEVAADVLYDPGHDRVRG